MVRDQESSFWRVQSYTQIFDWVGSGCPNPVWFKGRLWLLSFVLFTSWCIVYLIQSNLTFVASVRLWGSVLRALLCRQMLKDLAWEGGQGEELWGEWEQVQREDKVTVPADFSGVNTPGLADFPPTARSVQAEPRSWAGAPQHLLHTSHTHWSARNVKSINPSKIGSGEFEYFFSLFLV